MSHFDPWDGKPKGGYVDGLAFRRMMRAARAIDAETPLKVRIPPAPRLQPMDPSLKRLLDNLPKGDPDVQPPDTVEVWIEFCVGRHVVPAGKLVTIKFGDWCGPPMATREVLVHVRCVKTGAQASVRFLNWTHPVICAGDDLTISDRAWSV